MAPARIGGGGDGTATPAARHPGVGRRRRGDAPWRLRAVLAFADPIRQGVREALQMATEAGIQTVVVTGDHPATTAAIAAEAGLGAERIVTGQELEAWDDARLDAELATLHGVARALPEHKLRLVDAAKRIGRTVAVTGDGVNDAPALNHADVGVSMGSGTAVAKAASDLVLGDDSFATLLYAVRDGRRIVDNVRKGLVFLISTHVALLGFVLAGTLVGFSQPLWPLQILWLELFIDVSTSIAFEREPEEPDLMRRPPRDRDVPILPNWLLGRIGVAGGFSALAALALMLWYPGGEDHARWLAFTRPGREPGRPGLREPEPDAAVRVAAAEHVPRRGVRAGGRDPGPDPVHPGVLGRVPGDAPGPPRVDAGRDRRARPGRPRRDRPIPAAGNRLGRLRPAQPFVSWSWNSIVPRSAIERTMNEDGRSMP